MAASLAITHSVTSDQGTHFTDKETWQEPWRILAMGRRVHAQLASFLI